MIKTITLVASADATKIDLDNEIAKESGLLRNLLEEYNENVLEIPEVRGKVLNKIVDFLIHIHCNKIPDIPKPLPIYNLTKFVSEWVCNYLNEYTLENINDLFELIKAVDYMDIRTLLEILCAKAACITVNISKDKFCELYSIVPDLTEEEARKYEEDFLQEREREREMYKDELEMNKKESNLDL